MSRTDDGTDRTFRPRWSPYHFLASTFSGRRPARRWFRFSLRGLLIAMAVLSAAGAYVVRERQIIVEREATWISLSTRDVFGIPRSLNAASSLRPLSWRERVRCHLGDEPIGSFVSTIAIADSDKQLIAEVFPEAKVQGCVAEPDWTATY